MQIEAILGIFLGVFIGTFLYRIIKNKRAEKKGGHNA